MNYSDKQKQLYLHLVKKRKTNHSELYELVLSEQQNLSDLGCTQFAHFTPDDVIQFSVGDLVLIGRVKNACNNLAVLAVECLTHDYAGLSFLIHPAKAMRASASTDMRSGYSAALQQQYLQKQNRRNKNE